MIKTRIAPSPTGALHLGTARTALFNYLFAKQNQGIFILRIEDTDAKRSQKKWAKDIKNGLKWLGLNWDEEYQQSNRGGVYKKYTEKLLEQEKAYKKDGVIYLKVPNNQSQITKFKDVIRGEIKNNQEIEDFIISRNIKKPLYNLACVIDDCEMGITQVIRGEDHISNTFRQILIARALNIKNPEYAHLPLILGPDRSKMSKRHGATSIAEYKKDYLPEAMINFMALLGWNPGNNQEYFTREELIKNFSLSKVQKAGAIFNPIKLESINHYYIKNYNSQKLGRLLKIGERAIKLEQGRIRKLSHFKESLDFLRKVPDYNRELLFWGDLSEAEVGESLAKTLKGEVLKGKYLWPPRVAVSGKSGSPSYVDIKKVLGKKETAKRLKQAIEVLNRH